MLMIVFKSPPPDFNADVDDGFQVGGCRAGEAGYPTGFEVIRSEIGSRVDESQCAELGPADTDAEKSKADSEEDPWGPENRAYLIVETANMTSLVKNQ